MKVLDITRPLDHTTVLLKLEADEMSMLEEALSEFIRVTASHKVQAEYYGEEFLKRIAGLRDMFKDLIDQSLSS